MHNQHQRAFLFSCKTTCPRTWGLTTSTSSKKHKPQKSISRRWTIRARPLNEFASMHFYMKTLQLFRLSVPIWFNGMCKQMNLQWTFRLTCDRQLGSPPDHKVPKLQLARIIANVIFSYFFDRQSVPPPLYRFPPLLRLAFLDSRKQKNTKHAVENVQNSVVIEGC